MTRLDDEHDQGPQHHPFGLVRLPDGMMADFDSWIEIILTAYCVRTKRGTQRHNTSFGEPRNPARDKKQARLRPCQVVTSLAFEDLKTALWQAFLGMHTRDEIAVHRDEQGVSLKFAVSWYSGDPKVQVWLDECFAFDLSQLEQPPAQTPAQSTAAK